MELEILYTKNAEDLSSEKVVLKANTDCNIGSFYLTKAKQVDSEHISNNTSVGFWFPDIDVKTGDKIIIYTKEGSLKKKENEYFTSLFLYMGKTKPIWTDNSCAVLMKIENFQCKSTK